MSMSYRFAVAPTRWFGSRFFVTSPLETRGDDRGIEDAAGWRAALYPRDLALGPRILGVRLSARRTSIND